MFVPPIPQPPSRRLVKRYGAIFCSVCGFQWEPIRICNCQGPPPETAAKDGPDAAGLAQRIREAMKR